MSAVHAPTDPRCESRSAEEIRLEADLARAEACEVADKAEALLTRARSVAQHILERTAEAAVGPRPPPPPGREGGCP
jgi:hypothetical protein